MDDGPTSYISEAIDERSTVGFLTLVFILGLIIFSAFMIVACLFFLYEKHIRPEDNAIRIYDNYDIENIPESNHDNKLPIPVTIEEIERNLIVKEWDEEDGNTVLTDESSNSSLAEKKKTAVCKSCSSKHNVEGALSEYRTPCCHCQCQDDDEVAAAQSKTITTAKDAFECSKEESVYPSLNHKEEEECLICLNSFRIGAIICQSNSSSCTHKFHKECMIQWLQNHNCCPTCRGVIYNK